MSWPHWRLRCMCSLALALHAATARPRHESCQAVITLTWRPLSVSHALHVLSFCVLCLQAPPAVNLLEALVVGVCVCDGLLLLLFAYVALLLLPLRFFLGVGAPSLSLAGLMFKSARCGSFLLFVVASALGGLCVRDGLASSLCACRTSVASVEP